MQQLLYTPSLDSEPQKDMMTVSTSKLLEKKKPPDYTAVCLAEAALLA